ncbi:hypothetical protein Tco_0620999 [Tanacetum coccineum]
MSTPKFAETHNLVAFLEKPKESNGFEGIIDFLNASSIKYALTVNPIVYESCIQQFWAIAKAKTVNEECQIQTLVDKKKVIITEKSVRSDLMLEDTEGTELFLDKQVEGMSKHKGIYVTPSHTKKILKDEFQVSAVRVTYYWQVYLMLLVAFNIVVKFKNVEPMKQKLVLNQLELQRSYRFSQLVSEQVALDLGFRRKAKRTAEISQSSRPIPFVTDETVIKEWEDRMEMAAITASSLEAEQDIGSDPRCQNTILGVQKLKFDLRLHLNKSYDLPLSRLNTLRSREDNIKLKELMEFCTKLSVRALNISIKYALTVNPTVYESCIQQFWVTAKAKTVNGEHQIQALVDKKKVIITEKSVRSDLMLEDAKGIKCLLNDVIFEQLTLMGGKTTTWNEFSSTIASAIICLATNQKFNFSKYIFDHMMKNLEGGVKFLMYPRFVQVFLDKQVEEMSKHKGIYVTTSHTKKIFANMKREGKGFFGRITPLFQTMMVQVPEVMGEDSTALTDSHSKPVITQPSSSKPQKKKSKRKQWKNSGPTEPIPNEATNKEPISTPSCDPPQSAKTAQAKEIVSLKKRVKQLEKRKKSRTSGLKKLRKVGSASRVESSNDIDEEMLFDIQDDLQGKEVVVEKEVAKKEVSAADPLTTAGEVVNTASATTTVDELTLAQTLIEIKAAKLKAVTTAATTITTDVTSTRPKVKGILFHDQEEQASAFTPIVSSSQLLQAKDKGKRKMVELEKPLKKKDQIALDEELALRLHAEE